jgi:3-hydroxybutyrate dehydrogenase
MTIAGKRVLVTGGGSGAGADLALGFARAGAAEVVICGRRVPGIAGHGRTAPGPSRAAL